jgi:NADH-quinone oxidoreductase subunit E
LAETNERLVKIFSRFNGSPDELIPILEAAQEEYGYLSQKTMLAVSKHLRIPPSNVFGVATFYALFRLKPSGKNIIRVCRGTACHVRGGARILQEVETRLGITVGETTPDREYSLETISCFGSCALAPVMVINKDVYGRMTPSRVAEILKTSPAPVLQAPGNGLPDKKPDEPTTSDSLASPPLVREANNI